MAIVVFPPEGNVLLRHVVEREGGIPGLEGITGIARKVRRVGSRADGGFSVDWRNQNQKAPGVIDLAVACGDAKEVAVELEGLFLVASNRLTGHFRSHTDHLTVN
jgi:hypothetical protein